MIPRPAAEVLSWLALLLSPAAAACLVVAAVYAPEAIAAGEHLRALGLPVHPCPGCGFCGLSRGFAWMMRAEVLTAVRLNPLVLVFFPLSWALTFGGPTVFVLNRRSSS